MHPIQRVENKIEHYNSKSDAPDMPTIPEYLMQMGNINMKENISKKNFSEMTNQLINNNTSNANRNLNQKLITTMMIKGLTDDSRSDIVKRPSEQLVLNPNIRNDAFIDLILEPSATSVAGPYGKAIAMPISRAFLKQGHNTRIQFRPSSVAIVGPGGIAHAESDLDIDYIDE